MRDYPKLRSILGAIFSIDVGLSDAAQTAMLERSLGNAEWRAAFQNELRTAANDQQTSWNDLLSNNQYEVYDDCSEREAREIGLSLLWEKTFPDEPVPEL
jgi:hypothetical protein